MIRPTHTDGPPASAEMASRPMLFVCHGDDGGPRMHPCRRVQEALRVNGIEYDKVIAAHGSPWPWRRKGSREQLRAATADTKLPALKLSDGTALTHSSAILNWINHDHRPSGLCLRSVHYIAIVCRNIINRAKGSR